LTFEKYLNFSRIDLSQKSDFQIDEDLTKKFYQVVEELIENKPIQYILGDCEFYGLGFRVDESVLIPRQETEELVDWIINDFKVGKSLQGSKIADTIGILDIGTGSGCIAISLKKNLSGANVMGLDISSEAIKLATYNAGFNQTDIEFLQEDILNEVTWNKLPTQLSCIVSNPPYVLHSEKSKMQKNVINYEPHLALFVDDNDALLFYNAIAKFAMQNLKSKANLYFEINEAYGMETMNMLVKIGFENVLLRKDLNGKDRMIRATKPQ